MATKKAAKLDVIQKLSGKPTATNSADFSVVSDFLGYRNKEDITNLPPGYLVVGSQNILTTTAGRIGVRQGYTLDGQSESVIAPILSKYDWNKLLIGSQPAGLNPSGERNLKAGFLTSAGNDGKLKVRYVANAGDYYMGTTFTAGQVYWLDLMTGLTSTRFQFAEFNEITSAQVRLLFVNGSVSINEWTGGMTTLASSTSTSITKTGTKTWIQEGFRSNPSNALSYWGDTTTVFTISNTSGNTWRYTWTTAGTNPNISSTSCPVGTQVNITASGFTVNNTGIFLITAINTNYFEVTNINGFAETNKAETSAGGISYDYNYNSGIGYKVLINGTVYTYLGGALTTTITGVSASPVGEPTQSVIMQAVESTSSLTGIPNSFTIDLISQLNNSIYIGSLSNAVVYKSKTDSYTNYSYSSPTRLPGEGAALTLSSNPVAFIPQEETMYISFGKDYWTQVVFTLSSDLLNEAITVKNLKSGPRQAAKSQNLMDNVQNDVWFISNEPTMNSLGRVSGVIVTPQVANVSDPIKIDFDSYDFTDGDVKYFRNFVYVSIPKQNIVRVYNIEKGWWETPLILPVSQFAIINGELYGHSYQVGETYKLFSGYNDNGNPIDARALFSFQNFGTRSSTKWFDEFYIEGYIQSNTTLNLGIQYDTDGCATQTSYPILGTNSQIVCLINSDGSLGKTSLGKHGLGTSSIAMTANAMPPKFRGVKTFSRNDFYEQQTSFSSYGVDFRWEILAFGPLTTRTEFGNNNIKF